MATRESLALWTQEFLRWASPQTDLFESEPRVLSFIRECFAPRVEELELPVRLDRMGNALVELDGDPRRGRVLLLAYAMTHPAAGMDEPFTGQIVEVGGRPYVRGRGVCEQKGALVAALGAVDELHRNGEDRPNITFAVCTAGETGRHDAARAVLEAMGEPPDHVIVVIGTSQRVSLGNLGRIDLEVQVTGKVAHSSTPWNGVNAIDGAVDVLAALGRMPALGTDENYGPATLTTTAISSGPDATHTVQGWANLVLDRRLLPGEEEAAVFDELSTVIRSVPGYDIEVRQGPVMKAAQVSVGGPLMTHIQRGAELASLTPRKTFYSRGALDAGYFTHLGCEAVMWGPGNMEQWHSPDEMVSVDDLHEGKEAYLGFLRSVARGLG